MTVDLDQLNSTQRAAALTTEGPLLLLAGAGSGKTRVLTYRIAHLVDDLGVSPYQILAITFTNKAAAEMRERLGRLLARGLRGMWVSTFHAMCVRLLRADAEALGYTRNFTIYDDDDSKRLVKEIYAEFDIDAKRFPPNGVRDRISKAKNELIGPATYAETNGNGNGYDGLTARVYTRLQERLKRADAMDFDDLLFNAYVLLKKNPQILEAYQERFRYLLVDEYQDTNHAQYRITQLIAAKYRNIMVVGDDDQSIYSWRGADLRNILEFEKDYPEAQVIKLEQNYRSTATILAAANELIAHNINRKQKRLFTEGDAGEKVALYQASDERDEGRWIATEVEKLHSRGRAYRDFAVFYRTNAQSRVLEDMLLRAGVPYRLVGGTRFFDRAEIRDVMAYLKVVVNPADDIAAKRIINTPRRGIGKTTVERLESYAHSNDCSFMDAVELSVTEFDFPHKTSTALVQFAQLFKDARGYTGSLRDIVEMIIARSELLSTLEAERTEEARGRIENIHEFFGVVQEYDETHRAEVEDAGSGDEALLQPVTLASFMEWLALRSDLDSLTEGDDYLTLMTIHSAKGLEFPVVFIAGLEESLFPHIASADSPTGLEEERRLAYVAITRARELLHITYTLTRSLFGNTQANPPSRFIGELPRDQVVVAGVGSSGYAGLGHEKRGDRRGIYGSGSSKGTATYQGGRVYGSGLGSGFNSSAAAGAEAVKAEAARLKEKRDKETFAVGDTVDHKIFGRGIVTSADGDALHIRFTKTGETKKLLKGYAPIVKLG